MNDFDETFTMDLILVLCASRLLWKSLSDFETESFVECKERDL